MASSSLLIAAMRSLLVLVVAVAVVRASGSHVHTRRGGAAGGGGVRGTDRMGSDASVANQYRHGNDRDLVNERDNAVDAVKTSIAAAKSAVGAALEGEKHRVRAQLLVDIADVHDADVKSAKATAAGVTAKDGRISAVSAVQRGQSPELDAGMDIASAEEEIALQMARVEALHEERFSRLVELRQAELEKVACSVAAQKRDAQRWVAQCHHVALAFKGQVLPAPLANADSSTASSEAARSLGELAEESISAMHSACLAAAQVQRNATLWLRTSPVFSKCANLNKQQPGEAMTAATAALESAETALRAATLKLAQLEAIRAASEFRAELTSLNALSAFEDDDLLAFSHANVHIAREKSFTQLAHLASIIGED